ncbi:VOC family protein [Fulvivirgaceae bacterium BMA12]|uniref:VOC family protein n=1 Tax=Agaribacillus aureus TaxID=3051825 RepID=A0ABT8LFJ0_9BACT|nr:VOC family protein [Fulvivirgaceae bacterium BMA12]
MKVLSSTIHSTVPVVGTDDIQKSISYYTKVLGFLPDFQFGDPVVYAGVKSGEAEIYFAYDPDLVKAIQKEVFSPEIFIWITEADKLYQEHTNKGAEIIDAISDRPWGARQYVVKEINGYHLKFAQPL